MLIALYARGGSAWVLGFVALVPWLRSLDAAPRLRGALRLGWAMSVAYTAVAWPWFAGALGSYTGIGTPAALAVLLLAAPLLQPQLLVFALVRHAVGGGRPVLRALAGAAAWVATEYWVPRLLDDTWILGTGVLPLPEGDPTLRILGGTELSPVPPAS